MEIIRIDNLSKKYKDTVAVDGLSLSIEKGELFSLLGVNGAGKTTTIRMLSCLTMPTDGDAFLCGQSIRKNAELIKSKIAVSPQESAIAFNLSVEENLMLMAGVHGFKNHECREKCKRLTEQFNLKEVLKKRAGKLSGGWQRRLSIAMALISEPEILFLDEPTLGLDVIARRELWDIIESLKGKTTIILTTHYMEEAEVLSDRIAVMKRGKLIALGTLGELKEATDKNSLEDAFVSLVKEG